MAFEYAGIAKFGGLGEVSANQCRSLATEPELDLELFMPSHGKHQKLREKLHLTPLKDEKGNKLILKGRFDPLYFGISNNDKKFTKLFPEILEDTDINHFKAEIWHGVLDNVPINLLVGTNSISSYILNDTEIYGASTLNAKLGLFSLVMREYMRYTIFNHTDSIPDIIHIHDHHPVPALLCCKQELNLVGKDVRSIITMHLLTWPRRDLEFFWKCGVNNELMLVKIGTLRLWQRMRGIFAICKGNDDAIPTLEKIGCAIADKVIAVSENFLHSDIIPNCGGDIIRWKCDFTWNGCDWDYQKHRSMVFNRFQEYFGSKTEETIKSWDLRKEFLTKILGNLPADEPRINSSEVKAVIAEEFTDLPYHPDGSVDPFKEDGPLVLVTGRVSPQKGIETIFSAIPKVIDVIPNVKFLFLMVPTPYSIDDLRSYMVFARKYPNNVRFIFGIAGSIYLLAHLSADLYCCPSRWEPFGIVALEAMVSRLPIIATSVGGLKESILHIEDHPSDGTGILVPVEHSDYLRYGIISLLKTMQIAEQKTITPSLALIDVASLIEYIVHPVLHSQVKQDLLFGEKIRDNALKRVETTFRWKTVSMKLKTVYLSLNY
ncbi:Glycogen synthase [Candidatus Lokiarchaeum ossiferum]|uniref:Glycogen synthase n=1 Tax=Candidatus Lokiarchaeum ossiferum TaxID=2951803 RepID=A0ABY6I0K5_9ARCH|nr:Glycogen synthase [Candidatus Lokiarchaeum sp. B-35]